jgi:hypothetical protein
MIIVGVIALAARSYAKQTKQRTDGRTKPWYRLRLSSSTGRLG